MGNDRKLAYGEKYGSIFSSEKGRDRADARRQIAGLNQGDAQIELLSQVVDQMRQQTELLRYLAQAAHRQAMGTSSDLPLPPMP